MSIEKARAWLEKFHMEDRIQEFSDSSATVELAARCLNVEPARIAKSLSFKVSDAAILVIAAGDVKVDNSKFKAQFHTKAKMLQHDEVEPLIGHGVGGVCPFGVNEGVSVYLDVSLKRFQTVFPAVGTASSAVEMSPEELELVAQPVEWVDVCKAAE